MLSQNLACLYEISGMMSLSPLLGLERQNIETQQQKQLLGSSQEGTCGQQNMPIIY